MSLDNFLTYLYGVVESDDLATFYRNLEQEYQKIPWWRTHRQKEASVRMRIVAICIDLQLREARRHG